MSAGLQGAIESAPVTRLHERRSYDPADFGVPDGREEEWRFTPLRRLRGLHTDSPPEPSAAVATEVDPAPEVKTFSAERSVAHAGATFIPSDRISAQAYALSDEATVVIVPAEADTSQPTVVTVTGRGGAGYGHLLVQAEPLSRAVVVVDYRGSGTYADNVELVVGDGASLSVVSVAGWDDDAVHVSHHYATLGRDARLRHAAVSLGGSVVRLGVEVRYAGTGRGRRADRAVLRGRGPAPGAPAVHRPRRAALPQPGLLQGRAAGRGRARGLDRRRADPAGGDRDGHVRVQPEPGAVRRHPGGLGAEPGDPHRGDRRGRRTPAPADGSRTTTCST